MVKEPTQRRLLDWEPGARGELQQREDGPSGGSKDRARADVTKGHVFRRADVPFISGKGVSTTRLQILCVRKSISLTPLSYHVWPSPSGSGHPAALQASPVTAVSVPMGKSSGEAGRATSDAKLSLPSILFSPWAAFLGWGME